jgi:hypothetical protein
MAAGRWPATELEAEIPGGAWLTILKGTARFDPVAQAHWWRGTVLGPHGIAWINAVEGDLIPGDDPRLCASAA